MIDAQQALAQARSGMAPPDWQILPVHTGALVWRIIFGVFGVFVSLFGVGIATAMVAGGFFFAGQFGGQFGGGSDTAAGLFAILPLLVGAAFAAFGVFAILNALVGVRLLLQPPAQRPVLILRPDGVVERGGFWGNRIRAISYAGVAHAQAHITTTTTVNQSTGARSSSVSRAVIFTHHDGRKERWAVDGSFGRADDIMSRIVTAQIQYAALRGLRA